MKYLLSRAIYIYIFFIRLCAHFSDVTKWETWSLVRPLWQPRNTFGNYLATAKLFYSKQKSFGPVASNKQERKIIETKTIVGCVICLSEVRFSSSFHRQILSFPGICNFEFMLQHGKPSMNWFPPSDRCDWWIKDCFLSAPYIDRAMKTRKWNACEIALKCVNKLILFTGMFEFCRSNCFKERSQWRLESRRSPFFFVFVCFVFCCCCVFC